MNSRGIAWRSSFHERVCFVAAPVVMAVAAVASAVISAASAMQQGKAARQQAEYQAALAENNAIASRQQAGFDEKQHREKARLALSSQRARAAKSGVLSEGSPLFFNIDTGEQAEIGALNIRRQGEMRAQGFQSEAALGLFKGKVAQQQGYMSAGKSLLDGVSKVSGSWGSISPALSSMGSTASTSSAFPPMQDFGNDPYTGGTS
jgi:hypothetical protein